MKSNPRPIKSSTLQPLKSPSGRPGKFGKRKPLSSDFPQSQSQSRNKILTDDGPRRSRRLLEKYQISSVPDTSRTKRKILTVAPGNVKRFKDSQGKSAQDLQAGLHDLSKESSAKENETLDGLEAKLKSENPPVIPSPTARTWNKKKDVKVLDPEVKGPVFNEEDDDDDTEEEEDDDNEEGEDDTEGEGEKDIEIEADVDPLDSDAEDSQVDGTNATEIPLPNLDEEMEEANDDKGTKDVEMSPQLMTSNGQIISDVGINKTSPADDDSILARPSSQVRTDLTHKSAGNNTLDLSSADHAPNLSYHDGNMLDSLFHDEGNEELERITLVWNETPLRVQQFNSGQNRWNLIENVNELYIILAMAMALGIGFAVFQSFF